MDTRPISQLNGQDNLEAQAIMSSSDLSFLKILNQMYAMRRVAFTGFRGLKLIWY